MFYSFVIAIVRLYVFIAYRTRVTGKENIPEGGAVVCGNHTAQHDPIFVIYAFGRKGHLIPMSKAENRKKFFVGWVLKHIGTIFVDRGKSDIAAIKRSIQLLKSGGQLLIFPEGTRVKEGEYIEPKNGAVMLACRNNVPVVPVFITKGSKKAFSRVEVIIGKPYLVETSGKPGGDFLDDQARQLMNKIFALGSHEVA